MEYNVNDLIAMLKAQRNAANDESAELKAICDGYIRREKELKTRIAEL